MLLVIIYLEAGRRRTKVLSDSVPDTFLFTLASQLFRAHLMYCISEESNVHRYGRSAPMNLGSNLAGELVEGYFHVYNSTKQVLVASQVDGVSRCAVYNANAPRSVHEGADCGLQ